MGLGRWGRRRRLLSLLVVSLILLVFLLLHSSWREYEHLPRCPDSDEKYLTVDHLVVNDAPDGGVGNRLFELASFAMLATHLNRTPAISFKGTAGARRRVLFDIFPRLNGLFVQCEHDLTDKWSIAVANFSQLPFIDVPERLDAAAFGWRDHTVVRLDEVELLQSHRYFYGRRAELLQLLAFPPDVNASADRLMPSAGRESDINVCVHIRRGDFLYQRLHQHSTASFTLHATLSVLNTVRRPGASLRLLVFGNDHRWAHVVLAGLPQIAVDYPIEYIIGQRPQEDWALASRHCDAVLLTAPLSTFGWWLAYFSRDQSRVFYSSRFTKHNVSREVFLKEDFVPAEWQMIENIDDPMDDIPLSMRIPLYTWAMNWVNHLLRKYVSILYRL